MAQIRARALAVAIDLSAEFLDRKDTDYLRINVLVDELSHFDIRRGSFSIGFYIWYQASINKPNYLDSLVIKNATEMKVSERGQLVTGGGIIYRQCSGGSYASVGPPKFSYDVQYLRSRSYRGFHVQASCASQSCCDTIVNDSLELGDWNIIGANIFGTRSTASSAPKSANDYLSETAFSAADISITVARSSRLGFWKMITGTIAAAMLAFIAFFIPLKIPVPLRQSPVRFYQCH